MKATEILNNVKDLLNLSKEEIKVEEVVVEETSSGELDLNGLQSRRDKGESDEAILNDIVSQAGTNFTMNGQPFDLAPAMRQTSSTALLDFIMSGDVVDNSITKTDAAVKGISVSQLNLLGLPVDLVSAMLTSGESLVRSGANALASILPPTVSTTPSHKPLSNGLGSLSRSALFIIFFAPNVLKYSSFSDFPVTAVTS